MEYGSRSLLERKGKKSMKDLKLRIEKVLDYSNRAKINLLKEEDYKLLEEKLNIKFSQEFKRLNEIFRYDRFLYLDFYNIQAFGNYNILLKTLAMRKAFDMPYNTLVLGEDDVSIVMMKCFGDHEEVYWFNHEDIEPYCKGLPLESNPDIFPTFLDFYLFLLDKEEVRLGIKEEEN